MPEIQTAMKASGANTQNAKGTTGHARGGGPDLGAGVGAGLNARELAQPLLVWEENRPANVKYLQLEIEDGHG